MDFYQKFICEKAKYKRELLGQTFFPRTPVVLWDFSGCKKVAEYKDLLDGISGLEIISFVIMPRSHVVFPKKPNIRYLDSDITQVEKKKIMQAADFAIELSSNIVPILKTGCVPVAQLNGDSTVEYNPLHEKGNGFYFKDSTKWEIFAALIRALETYKFPFDWENLIREVLRKKS